MATRDQAAQLSVDYKAMLHVIVRVRRLSGQPAIFERIFVPVSLMPVRVIERLCALNATAEEAKRLGLKAGAVLLEISRVATDVSGRPVELRISRCDTRRIRYAAEVL